MDLAVDGERLPRVAASLLLGTGAVAFMFSVAVFVVQPPSGLLSALPGNYRVVLAVLAVGGGVAHVLAGIWTRNRRPIFRIVTVTLVGMVLLQVSAPIDILVLVVIGLSRDEFEDSDW